MVIKEIEYDRYKEKINIKYLEGTASKQVKDTEPPKDDLSEVLAKLQEVGYRILRYPFSMKGRIIITGAKFWYDEFGGRSHIKLLAQYQLDKNERIALIMPQRAYKFYNKDELDLIDKLIAEAIDYVNGKRAQIPLIQENKPAADELPAAN